MVRISSNTIRTSDGSEISTGDQFNDRVGRCDHFNDDGSYRNGGDTFSRDLNDFDSISAHRSPFDPAYPDLDKIKNPYDAASDFLDDQSVLGKARYLHELEKAKMEYDLQMMHYQNWYNSPAQVAARQRAAGINPDLVGLQGAESASAESPDGSGVASVTPTDLAQSQMKAQKISNIMSVVNGIAGVASLATNFAQLSMMKSQKNLLSAQGNEVNLNNIAKEKALLLAGLGEAGASAISAAVASGDESFDFSTWLGSTDHSGIFNAYSSGHPNSRAIFDNLLTSPEVIQAEAMRIAEERAATQSDFSKIAGSKYYSDDVVIQMSMVGPLMDAQIQLEQNNIELENKLNAIRSKYASNLDVEGLADSANKVAASQGAEADYQTTYYSSLDAEEMAAIEFMIKQNEKVKATMEKQINDNLKTVYMKNKDNERGFAAAYLFTSGASAHWTAYLGAYELTNGINRLNTDPSTNPNFTPGSIVNPSTPGNVNSWMYNFDEPTDFSPSFLAFK